MQKFATSTDIAIRYLASSEAIESIRADPYWPKWASPWWQMTALYELGEARRIPAIAVRKMIEKINAHYLKSFPFNEEELPRGVDPYRHVACHCALGTIYQVLWACGIDVDDELPWIRPWFLKYQLPDGGLNCAESAYTESRKSSMVSTLPPLEAILCCTDRDFSDDEKGFLDRGANYLVEHKLFRSKTTGEILDERWLKPCFPRFYEYDVLRGLRFLSKWAQKRAKRFPVEAAREGLEILSGKVSQGTIKLERLAYDEQETLTHRNGKWCRFPRS